MFAVIMAGGFGTRFWPRSRKRTPKQFLDIYGGKTMIQQTLDRFEGLVSGEDSFIVTNAIQVGMLKEQIGSYGIPDKNIIAEPMGRNTAPAIALAALFIKKYSPEKLNETMVVLPSDHLITDFDTFRKNLNFASKIAQKTGDLVTFGIPPTFPATGYGYIQRTENALDFESDNSAFKVKAFAEKPNYATAERFLKSGEFLWNSGMFVWQVSRILEELEKYMPETMEVLNRILDEIGTEKQDVAILEAYTKIKGESIDYGVMEKSENISVVTAQFDWNDLGSWKEVYTEGEKDEQGNVKLGNIKLIDTKDSLFYHSDPKKMIAAIGVEDLLVVDTKNALLVCNKNNAQDVKKIVEALQEENREEFL